MSVRKVICTLTISGLLLAGCAGEPAVSGTPAAAARTAQQALKAGNYESAVSNYQTQISSGLDEEGGYRGLGIAYMGLGDYKEAADAFEKALEYAPAIPGPMEYDINYYLGSCFYKLGKLDDAKTVYDAIIGLRPKDPDALSMRGTILMSQKDTDGMMADYKKAMEADPENYDRLVQIYQKLAENGYDKQGKELIGEALTERGDSMSDYDKGRLSFYAGDYDTAKTCLEKISDKNNWNVTILLGQTYEALGDYNYATSVYESFLKKDTSHAQVYNQLGLCQLQQGKYQDALQSFRQGQTLNDETMKQSLAFNEIVANEYLGNFQRASVLMADYVKTYPGDSAARREYEFLQTR